MPKELPPVRRIVTGYTREGRSTIVEDGPPPVIGTVPKRPGLKNANIWTTGAAPVLVTEPDTIAQHKALYPPKSGTVIRIMDIPPEPKSRAELEQQFASMTSEVFPDRDKVHADKARHPGMHITDTVDYAIILSGEMYAVLEETETLMKAGDVLVQRGTNHAWSNRSDAVCRVAFILVDGRRS